MQMRQLPSLRSTVVECGAKQLLAVCADASRKLDTFVPRCIPPQAMNEPISNANFIAIVQSDYAPASWAALYGTALIFSVQTT